MRQIFYAPRGMAHLRAFANQPPMIEGFDPDEFLAEALRKARTKAAMAEALDVAPARINEFYNEPGKKKRALTMREGLILADRFGLDLPAPFQRISAEKLSQVLRVCLRSAQGDWSAPKVERLATEIVLGLELLQALTPSQGDQPPPPDQPTAGDQRPDKPL